MHRWSIWFYCKWSTTELMIIIIYCHLHQISHLFSVTILVLHWALSASILSALVCAFSLSFLVHN